MKDLIGDRFDKILETLKIKKQNDVWSAEIDLKKLKEVIVEVDVEQPVAKVLLQEKIVDTLEGDSLFD